MFSQIVIAGNTITQSGRLGIYADLASTIQISSNSIDACRAQFSGPYAPSTACTNAIEVDNSSGILVDMARANTFLNPSATGVFLGP
jgi:hypothetical protein